MHMGPHPAAPTQRAASSRLIRGIRPTNQKVIAMYTEPQSVTVATVATPLPRVAMGDHTGSFEDTGKGLKLSIQHQLGARTRRTARIDFTKTAADPLLDGVSRQYTMSAYVVLNHPVVGFNAAEVEANAKALTDWLSVAGNLTKLANGES